MVDGTCRRADLARDVRDGHGLRAARSNEAQRCPAHVTTLEQ
jgi:hypothetical protein